MNPHLSSGQVSRWMMGERTAAEVEHVRECPECHAEVMRLAGALAQFRDSVRQWGDGPQKPWSIETAPHHGMRWALVAAILIAAVLPISRAVTERRKAEAARADAILLEQVDAGVSRAIARPMEPWAKFMTWNDSRKSEEIR